ncbi:muramidase [Sphingomonas carotinifaciens]|uniref:Muramidase n=1 Tax=Sphingomonas carotinifaciens TaxID=1166323 RepID=A0A6N8M0U3_9SPHN|nr:muramidase [Sphingomonas carotinifaciens]
MLPTTLTAKAIKLCAAMLGASGASLPASFPIVVTSGVHLTDAPQNAADAEATVRDLIALGADFTAGPLAINGRDFATYGVTPRSAFDPCALARIDGSFDPSLRRIAPTVSSVTALLRQAFGARITDTIRPTNATYGARYSWHKVGQAIDFVPAGGVGAIDRAQIRALLASHQLQVVELLGPGDPGHSNHWHVAFAQPGQISDDPRRIEGDEDWIVDVPNMEQKQRLAAAEPRSAAQKTPQSVSAAPPTWDVFATAQWQAGQGGG